MALTDVTDTDQPTTMPPPVTPLQWTSQVPAPAPPQPQVVDRVDYLGQLKQAWTQMEEQRIQAESARQRVAYEQAYSAFVPPELQKTINAVNMFRDIGTGARNISGFYSPNDVTAFGALGTGNIQLPQESPQNPTGLAPSPGAANYLMNLAAAPATLTSSAIGEIPTPLTLSRGQVFGDTGAGTPFLPGIKVGQPEQVKDTNPATQFVYQMVPYMLAPGVGQAAFLASMPEAVRSNVEAYRAGQIDGRELAKNLAMTLGPLIAPELARLGIKGVAEAVRIAGTPRGQEILARAGTLATSERGGGTFGEKPPVGPEGEPPVGLPASGEGATLPAPPEVTSLATRDSAILQVSEWARKAEKVRPEQQAMFQQQRAQQLAKAERAFQSGEGVVGAKQIAAGAYKRPDLKPLELAPEHEAAIRNEIDTSPALSTGNRFSANDGLDAMKRGHLPQPDEAIQLAKILGVNFLDNIRKAAPVTWWDQVLGVLGIPQGLQSTLDASALMRQMAPLGWANPVEYFDAIGTIGRAIRSDAEALAVQHETNALPWVTTVPYPEAAGLDFASVGGRQADIGGHLTESEGQFSAINRSLASRALEKLPWVKPSERIYNVPINRLRANVYAKWAENLWNAGERDPAMYKAVADVVDHGSGWSNIVPGKIARGFNAFYSARNTAARFQVILDPILQPGSLFKPSARQLAARNLVGFTTANAGMLALMAGSGALAGKTLGIPNPIHVELNPWSTDSWKARMGNMRIDFTGGYGSILRLVSRLSPLLIGQAPKITSANGVTRDATVSDLVDQFVRGKMGPVPGIIWDAFGFPGGQTYAADFRSGKGLRTVAYNNLTSFFVQDVVEAYRQQGLAAAAIAAPASFLGAGVNSYTSANVVADNAVKNDPLLQGKYEHYADLPNDVKGEFDKRHPAVVAQLKAEHVASGRSAFDDLRQASAAGLADLGQQLKSGQLQPADYRKAVSDFIGSQSDKFQQALTDAGLSGRDLKGDPKLLNDFFTAIGGAENPATKQVDFDKQAQLEQQFRGNLSDAQNQRLDQMLSYSSDPTYAQLKQDKMILANAGYYDRQRNTFTDWLSGLQKSSAPADLKQQAQDWTSVADLQAYARNVVTSHGGPPQYYNLQPIWKGWQKFYDGANQSYLASHPDIDVLAVLWGYQDRVHSADAARLYKEKTGLNPPVPR